MLKEEEEKTVFICTNGQLDYLHMALNIHAFIAL